VTHFTIDYVIPKVVRFSSTEAPRIHRSVGLRDNIYIFISSERAA